jgi:tetratricopeptide (TPR) repeat protein
MTTQETLPAAGSAAEVLSGGRGSVDRGNRIVAAAVGLAIFAVYWITLAPGVSFWDSGEFIAASHSLGIPHPPGTPLYVLMGRVFSILGHGFLGVVSVAKAVNLLSAIPSAIAAVFLYLSIVRVGKRIWNGGDQTTWCLPAVVAGATAALFAAFASTLWTDSIEAEVYAVSGMWTAFAAWLTLLWTETEPKDERLLLVIAYLLALNIGVHLATYLAALAILPFAFLYERRFAFIVSFFVVLTMAKDLQLFLVLVTLLVPATLQFAILPPDYTKRFRTTLLVGQTVAVLAALIAFLTMDASTGRTAVLWGGPILAFLTPWIFLKPPSKLDNPLKDLGFLLTVATVLGFSCHLYLPIRSVLDPAMNEGQPDTWAAFWDVILRSQYRPVSVFERQASYLYQFDHMFWRYFREQWKPEFLWWVLGIPGLVVHWRRHPRTFAFFGLLFLWTSAALVLKMNFTDHEVRERDYFFAPGFFWFATWMGLGLGWLVHLVTSGLQGPLRRPVGVAAAVVAVIIAALPVRGHWETHDRRGNWIAHDYAENMLAGLERDAVVFTNGDNDTFPLWYLQEVHDFRKDVRVVNLSLLNTSWYAEQLRNEEPRVPMTYTTEQLYRIRPSRDPDTGRIYYVKDIVAQDILNANYMAAKPRPVYFAVTVDDLLGLEPYLELQGLVFRFDPELAKKNKDSLATAPDGELASDAQRIIDNVDLGTTRRNLEDVYRYRGLLTEDGDLDPDVYRDDNDRRLTTNYAAAWARMGLANQQRGNLDAAIECMQRALRISPQFDVVIEALAGMLISAGRESEAKALFLEAIERKPDDVSLYLQAAYISGRMADWESALDWYLQGLRLNPTSPDVMSGLYQSYRQLNRLDDAENVLRRWLDLNPEDASARAELAELQRSRAGDTSGASGSR